MPWVTPASIVVPEHPEPGDLLVAANAIIDEVNGLDTDGTPMWPGARWRGKTQNGVGILFCVVPVDRPEPTHL